MSSSSLIQDAEVPIYGGPGMSFMQQPLCQNIADSQAQVIVTGVPYDMSTSGRPGARFGPDGIRQASANLVWEGAR